MDLIQHYGVKGMKWGVRRTPAQLARSAGRKFVEAHESANAKSDARKVKRKERRTRLLKTSKEIVTSDETKKLVADIAAYKLNQSTAKRYQAVGKELLGDSIGSIAAASATVASQNRTSDMIYKKALKGN